MRKIFYGWYVTLACAVGIGCGLASVISYTFSIFLGPLQAEFGWTQPQVFNGLLLVTLTVTVAAPFLGAVVDRVGAKRMILVGLAMEALVLASFAWQDNTLSTFYLRYVVLAVLGLGATHVGFTRVISLWFDRRRGLALGIALAGLGAGGFIWPILTQWAIDTYDWRTAYLILAGLVVVVGMTTILLVVRDTPQSMGLLPDGDTVPPGERPVQTAQAGMTVAEALRTGRFWIMVSAFLLIGVGVTSVQIHLVPLLTSRGVSPMMAATALSILAVALVGGRLAAGWLMDRFFAPRVAIAFLLGPIVAVFLLAAGASGPVAFLAGILTGLAAGAEVDVTAYLAGRYFGLINFSSIYAWFYSAYSLGAGIGPRLTAGAVQEFGGYTEILYFHAVLLVTAALLLWRLGPFPRFR
jgi:OFA family oxalate/formate antiporter-like MFS transporter